MTSVWKDTTSNHDGDECTCDSKGRCICGHISSNPGKVSYSCPFCGDYVAGSPACINCAEVNV